jgi:hypothetical protein
MGFSSALFPGLVPEVKAAERGWDDTGRCPPSGLLQIAADDLSQII